MDLLIQYQFFYDIFLGSGIFAIEIDGRHTGTKLVTEQEHPAKDDMLTIYIHGNIRIIGIVYFQDKFFSRVGGQGKLKSIDRRFDHFHTIGHFALHIGQLLFNATFLVIDPVDFYRIIIPE